MGLVFKDKDEEGSPEQKAFKAVPIFSGMTVWSSSISTTTVPIGNSSNPMQNAILASLLEADKRIAALEAKVEDLDKRFKILRDTVDAMNGVYK